MQNGNEAIHGSTTADILLPIQIDLTPDDAILQDNIIVTVSFSSGTATGMYNQPSVKTDKWSKSALGN